MTSKLTDFYIHKASLLEKGEPIDPQWEQLEEQLLKEEVLPELIEQMKAVLSKVKSPLMLNVNYDPNGCIGVSFTRSCALSMMAASASAVKGDQPIIDSFISPNEENQEETKAVKEEVIEEPRFTKAKSIGFSVSFKDGTIYHEKKAVNTWLLALKKIGLENICNNRSKHTAWHRVNGQDICIVERTETVRDSDGRSPQTLVDGFYVMTQLSNDQKEKDLLALGDYLPKLGIKVIWDDVAQEIEEGNKKPSIDEEAALMNYPIKMQFHSYLARTKSEGTANSYTSTLDNAVRIWINKEVDENADSVFSYTSPEDVHLCIDMLNASADYVAENDRKHHSMSAALNQYLKFIEEREERRKGE